MSPPEVQRSVARARRSHPPKERVRPADRPPFQCPPRDHCPGPGSPGRRRLPRQWLRGQRRTTTESTTPVVSHPDPAGDAARL